MQSAHCVRAVFTALGGVHGISRADVSFGRAVIEHDGSVDEQAIRDAVAIAGFEVSSLTHNSRILPLVV